MMTISESNYSSNQMSSIRTINDKVVHQDNFNDVQQSSSTNSALITKRGFKPSDMFDPQKKEFLTSLSYKLFPNDHPKVKDPSPDGFLEENYETTNGTTTDEFNENRSPITVGDKEIDLNKIFTPAPDAEEYIIKKNNKTFASSAFYATGLHPTVKDQIELAKKISSSLSEPANQLSKGQSMYVSRKNRSVKWVHEGKGRNTSNTSMTPTPSSAHDTPYRPPSAMKQQQQQPKYNTLPRSFPNPPKVVSTNTLPRMEPFPEPATTLTPLPELYIPPLQTKLNEVYSSPQSAKLNSWNGKNYNTAARGWGDVKAFYRPVTFDDKGNCNNLPFSDF
ncbi:uncharacterized protein LOC143912886 isoform X2 [Arctopsyche grandis]|uniref:uncharacterized protein LOC143912886 isoform X2 n=1 Tax=Arctopsyche grandis TaxID=121162 RepID=UPI00406D7226